MTCKTCGKEVPSRDLVCRACVARRVRAELLARQLKLIPDVLLLRVPLRLARKGVTFPYHIALLGDEGHSYCAEDIHEIGPRLRKGQVYSKLLRVDLCPACLKVLDGMIAQVEEVA